MFSELLDSLARSRRIIILGNVAAVICRLQQRDASENQPSKGAKAVVEDETFASCAVDNLGISITRYEDCANDLVGTDFERGAGSAGRLSVLPVRKPEPVAALVGW